ncbi:helix-turn-helix domain-containing protein [Rhizosphaericola mali]|uniref:AraC family transcriptional regulator n=1 Tax=Rhizosphaericola mali TaxID=2545455 RepID=A0A5P2G2R4_9BACT|nr:helix-turn-helix domain-containing protein [Rhizosphaericola mali]QES88399.1 AraC family transcriptional regulator [Rhizosphaericola mali]
MKDSILNIPINYVNTEPADNKRSFGMESFELSVLETFETTTIKQRFQEPIFYNLLRGKKLMKFKNDIPIEYLPGSTMIVPPNLEMEVNFPDSSLVNPTQCLSLTIDKMKIASSLSLLNERYPRLDGQLWQLSMKDYSVFTNEEISSLIYKLYHLANQNTQEARIIAELTLTELLVLLFQSQNRKDLFLNNSFGALNDLVRYIQDNLDSELTIAFLSQQMSMSKTTLFRTFKREFNITPLEYINKARIERAKRILIEQPHLTIAEISYLVGFENPNYFTRLFKQYLHTTPTILRKTNQKLS